MTRFVLLVQKNNKRASEDALFIIVKFNKQLINLFRFDIIEKRR